jgi:alpha-amylase
MLWNALLTFVELQYLMVDIVVNHNGWNGPPDSVDYSKFNPFNKKEYYNTPYCEIDYNNLDDTVSSPWISHVGIEPILTNYRHN